MCAKNGAVRQDLNLRVHAFAVIRVLRGPVFGGGEIGEIRNNQAAGEVFAAIDRRKRAGAEQAVRLIQRVEPSAVFGAVGEAGGQAIGAVGGDEGKQHGEPFGLAVGIGICRRGFGSRFRAVFFGVPSEVDALPDHEDKGHAHEAEQFEVHPNIFWVVVGHIQIGGA